MKKIYLSIFLGFGLSAMSQVCNTNGNLMIFTNYDGGTLNINVDQNIPNLKIGICTYEACIINLSGAFVNNVTEVRYAGFNSNNNHCGMPVIPTTVINGAPMSAMTTTVFSPPATLSNPNGWTSIICAYSCNNTANQGGCNTVDQVEAYFLNYFSGSTLYAHRTQYGCWTGTNNLSAGGNCCPPPVVYPGVIAASQTICSGFVPAALSSVASATAASGSISYQWESSTTSPSSGFANIPSATSPNYIPAGSMMQTIYYRRAASTVASNVAYSNVVTITVLPLPPANISGPSAVCAGSSATLTASGGTSYVWSAMSVTGPTLATTGGAITMTCYAANGCSATASHNISTNPLPNIVAVSPVLTACAGVPTKLTAVGASSYTWQPGNLTGSSVTVTPLSVTVYTVTGSDVNNCQNTAMLTLNVDPVPVITINASSNPACSGKLLSLTAGGASSYTWMPGGSASSTLALTATASVIYTVTGADPNCSSSSTLSLVVIPSPTVNLTASRDKICAREQTTLSATGGTAYAWQNPGMTATTASVIVSPTLTTSYSVVATGTNGCTENGVKSVTVSQCTGIAALDQEPLFKVYPNPGSGEIFINGHSACELEVINTAGQLVKRLQLNEKNEYRASLSHLAEGIYFVVSGQGAPAFRQKIVVTK